MRFLTGGAQAPNFWTVAVGSAEKVDSRVDEDED